MSESYWILCKRDDAICGCVTGVQLQEVIAGPFDDWEKAYAHKASYRRHGSTFYTVTESSERPEEYERSYGFVDADREFDDVSDHAYCNDW